MFTMVFASIMNFGKEMDEIWHSTDEKKKPDGAIKPFSRVLMNPPFKLPDQMMRQNSLIMD